MNLLQELLLCIYYNFFASIIYIINNKFRKRGIYTMRHKLTRLISVLVLVVTVFNGIALTSQKAYAAVTPQKVVDAIDKFVGAIGKFAAKDATKNIGKIADFCNRLSGLTSVASGIIGILQMIGVIKDPTLQMIGKVLDTVKDVQTSIAQMNNRLNQIVAQLIQIQVADEEKYRNKKAQDMSTNWNNFNTNYTEKLQTYVNEYEAKINTGIRDWWNQASHEGVYVLMTKKYSEENSLTYSKKKYSEGLPATSDIKYVIASTDETVTETVNTDWSIGIPPDYMPNTSAVTFNIDTYRDDFKKIMVTALEKAISDDKLTSDCGASVKSEYSTLSKDAMLENYADNVLNTEIYKIACEVMSNNNSWVAQVLSVYMQYCDNILKQESGINAFLNYIFCTHAFEGEVKENIVNFCDGMIAQIGFYGSFAMTCAGQDSLQTTATKEQIREYFVNTVLSLNERKAKAITGHNNYCYITGTILEADKVKLTADMCMHLKYGWSMNIRTIGYTGCDASSWQISVPKIVDTVYLPVIYNQYPVSNDAKTFGEYLNKYGVQADTSNKTYLTNCKGAETFALSEGIYMRAEICIPRSNYFSSGSWYHIDVGTSSKVGQEHYLVHDKVVGDWFNSNDGSQSVNAVIAARAAYGETYSLWFTDEAWMFAPEGVSAEMVKRGGTPDEPTEVEMSIHRYVDILKSTPCHDLNGDTTDPENPFFAFDMVSLTPIISDNVGPSYQNTSKDITDIQLDSESFPYTGQPIEPAVTVFASGDIVPEDGYTVTYINNLASNDYGVVKVEGKGNYAGTITRHFMITSSSPIHSSSSSGCNSLSVASVAFGLVFMIRKFRKR